MRPKIDIKKHTSDLFARENLTLIFGLCVAFALICYWPSCERKGDRKKMESDSLKFQVKADKMKLPKLQEKKDSLKAQIKVLIPKREKEIQKIETLKHDSVPCPEIVSQCDSVIKADSELIAAQQKQIRIDSNIIAVQSSILTNQDGIIESQANEIATLKESLSDTVRHFRRKKIGSFLKGFGLGFAAGVTAGQLTNK